MTWLSAAELVAIHGQVIEQTGGLKGIINPGAVESAIARPFTSFGGVELYPELADKVAALIHTIVSFHPFADGNKRTALVAADVCLRLNGLRLVPSDEVEPFIWSVARGERSVEDIAAWLRRRIETCTE